LHGFGKVGCKVTALTGSVPRFPDRSRGARPKAWIPNAGRWGTGRS